MRFIYLACLLLSITGLGILDFRLGIAFFREKIRTIKTIATTVSLFVIWDIIGIKLDIFFIGRTKYLCGIRIGDFPLEELFFLVLLCYSALISYLLTAKIMKGTS